MKKENRKEKWGKMKQCYRCKIYYEGNFCPNCGKIAIAMLFFLLLIITSCSKDKQISALEKDASTVAQTPAINQPPMSANISSQLPSQTVFVPMQQESQSGVISPNYESPCLLKKWDVANYYCNLKNFWHNQSTLLSWYIPYSIILLALVILFIWIWMTRNR